jgi:hypothetical protein
MARLADAVVVVTAGNPSLGRFVPVDSSDGTALTLQFELVDLTITQPIKGGVIGSIALERMADQQNGRPIISHHDGGGFIPGASYLFFLQRQSDSPTTF